jgi:hypothetical protein
MKKYILCRALVAHTYNPSYSGGRDQEDRSQPKANSVQDASLKKTFTKKAQGIGPEFKPQYHKKKKEMYIELILVKLCPQETPILWKREPT